MERQRLRFTVSDDITLVKEVLSENPFEDSNKWNCIQEKVNNITSKMFSIRCLKEHLQYLMVSISKEDNFNRRKSGTEDDYRNLKILLQDAIDLSRLFSSCDKKRRLRKQINFEIKPKEESFALSEADGNSENSQSPSESKNCLIFEEVMVSEVTSSPDLNCTSSLPNQIPELPDRRSHFISNKRRKASVLNFIKEKQHQERVLKMEERELQLKKIRLEEAVLEVEKEKLRLENEKLRFEIMKFEREAMEREIRLQLEVKEKNYKLLGEQEQRHMLLSLFKFLIVKKE